MFQVYKVIVKYQELFEGITKVESAKVPLVKFKEKSSNIWFDISFNSKDGIRQITELQKAFKVYPELRYLIMIMKCILK